MKVLLTAIFVITAASSVAANEYRDRFRVIFEESFVTWIENMSRAEGCATYRFDETAISEVIVDAAGAFHPGITNFFKRREYRLELEGKISLAKLSGFNKTGSGCLLARNLAEVSRLPVDRAIEAADDLK